MAVTPEVVSACMFAIFTFCALWPFLGDAARKVLGLSGVGCCCLMVLTASPQYLYGFLFTALGLLFMETFSGLFGGVR